MHSSRRRSSMLSRSQSSLSRGDEVDESHVTQLSKSDVVLTFQIEVIKYICEGVLGVWTFITRLWFWKFVTWNQYRVLGSSTAPWRWTPATSWPRTRWRPASLTGTHRGTSPQAIHFQLSRWNFSLKTLGCFLWTTKSVERLWSGQLHSHQRWIKSIFLATTNCNWQAPEWYKANVSKGSQDQELKIKVAVRMDKPMNMKHCG